MESIAAELKTELKKIEYAGLKRSMPVIYGPQAPRVRVGNKEVLLLCSNNYLGLAGHPGLKEAALRAMENCGFGAGASRLVSGNMTAHMELEEKISNFKGTDSALLFNSGYHANVGVIPVLAGRGDEIFSDKLNHASIIDGCILSRAKLTRYPHRDTDALERLVKKSRGRRKLIVTDGVFSMDGDVAPVKGIAEIAEKYGATVLIDDAHGTGVIGKNGKGTLEHAGIKGLPSIIQMGTLGKALGAFGAFIAGSKDLKELLINRARSFVYTTALPVPVCAAAKRAVEIVEQEPERRARLHVNAAFLRDGLKETGLDTMESATPIIPVIVGSAEKTMEMAVRLLEKGLFIQGIRPPTVPENTARLRVTVTADHTREDLEYALKTIKEVFGECR
jgi:glycine C-acetyltransferase